MNEIIKAVSQNKRLKADLLKAENGNNFRAVSESAILDAVVPVLESANIYYTIKILDSKLDVKEAYGKNGRKLQFIATVALAVNFIKGDEVITTESVGMGIDDNDKAMGKAYTYAFKYALLKFFRLRFGDDPDFKASEPLNLDAPKKGHKKEESPTKNEQYMSEAQKNFIIGLMKQKGISSSVIISKFNYDPTFDIEIPMKVARSIIEFLQQEEDLPF